MFKLTKNAVSESWIFSLWTYREIDLKHILNFLCSCINIADTQEGSVSNLCLGEANESDIAKHTLTHAWVLSDVNELYLYKIQYIYI